MERCAGVRASRWSAGLRAGRPLRLTSAVAIATLGLGLAACAPEMPLATLGEIAAEPGDPRIVSAAGTSRDGQPIRTLEHGAPFDPARSEPRLVLVGGLDGNAASARIVSDAVYWFKREASDDARSAWLVSALPLAAPSNDGSLRSPDAFPPVDGYFDHADRPGARYVWRWVSYQAPDLVVEVRVGDDLQVYSSADGDDLPPGSLAAALADPASQPGLGPVDTLLVTARASDGPEVMRAVLDRAAAGHSALRATILDRMARDPLDVARLMARRYPGAASISYIPALTWIHTLRVADMDDDASLREKVMTDIQPWLSGEQALFGERVSYAAIAGTMIFSEIARRSDDDVLRESAERLAAEGVALAAAETSPGVGEHASGWSDDFFLGTIASVRAGDADGVAAAVRLVLATAARLQQPNGLFHHDAEAPVAWGRGNGFGALGLSELLTVLPDDHPDRADILDVHRRHLEGMRAQQAPDGMWRQIVDVPGSYRETSVTAMTLTAMARGMRLGWLDDSYLPVVDRAWRALLAHVADDGALVDVCFSTGAGPTERYYLDRPAVNGADDRGGAMVLGAALEYYDLTRNP